MGMYGDQDIIVHPRQWQPLSAGVPQAQIERFANAGHFIMLDEPQRSEKSLRFSGYPTPPIRNMAINTSNHETSQIGEILLLGVEEIISRSGMNAVLNLAQFIA